MPLEMDKVATCLCLVIVLLPLASSVPDEDVHFLRARLVRSLGLTRMPNVTQAETIPRETLDRAYRLYRKHVAQTERRQRRQVSGGDFPVVFTFRHDQGAAAVPPPNATTKWLHFDVGNATSSRAGSSVSATLVLDQSDVVVHGVGRDGRLLPPLDGAGPGRWDASATVRTWLRAGADRGVLAVTCNGGCPSAAVLRVRLVDDGRRRSRRFAPYDLLKEPAWTGKTDCQKRVRHNYCCRKSLQVTAEQLGLGDVILEPKQFNFYHCRGKCPHRYNPASTHAILQSLIYKMYRKGGKVCCAPSKLGDLEVLHLDESGRNPVHSQWKNAIVLECACS